MELSWHIHTVIKLLYVMKTIVILLLAAIAVAQFTMPDIAQIGDAIKNEVVSVQQKIEHLTKEEIQAAEKKISEGLDIIKGGENHPEPVKQEETKTAEAQVLPAILVGAAPVVLEIPAETKQAEHVSPVESAPALPTEVPIPAIADNLEPPGHKQKGHKKSPRRESRSEEEFSDDIQEKRRPEHRERKENDEKGLKSKQNKEKRHQYTPEELQKKREEREQRIKDKEERKKAYEKKRRAERDSDSESESQERFSKHQRGAEGRKHKDRGQEAKKNPLPDVAGLENVQVLTKMAMKSP